MPTIRQVKNLTDNAFTLMVPGYDTTQAPPVLLAPGVTVDLLTLVTGDQLEAMQGEILSLIATGSLADEGDISSTKPALSQPSIALPDAPAAAIGYTQADIQAMVDLLNQLKATVNAMNA